MHSSKTRIMLALQSTVKVGLTVNDTCLLADTDFCKESKVGKLYSQQQNGNETALA